MPLDQLRHLFRTARGRRLFLGLILFLVTIGSLAEQYVLIQFVSQKVKWVNPGVAGADLYSPWLATKAAIHGQDPYSKEITRSTQEHLYQHPLVPGAPLDQQAFVYPAHIVLILAPFTFLPGPFFFTLVLALSFPVIAGMAAVWLHTYCPVLRPGTAMVVGVVAAASWPAVMGALCCQPSVYVIAAVVFSAWLLHRNFDRSAGVLLALATVKPQLLILIVPWLLVAGVRQRRLSFVLSFLFAVGTMVLISLAIVPQWIGHWLNASSGYLRSGKMPLLIALAGHKIGTALCCAVAAAAIAKTRKFTSAPPGTPAFAYAVAVLLAATNCLIPLNAWLVYNDLLLIPAMLFLLLLPVRGEGQSSDGVLALAAYLIGAAFLAPLVFAALSLVIGVTSFTALGPSLIWFLLPIPVTALLLLAQRPALLPLSVPPSERVLAA